MPQFGSNPSVASQNFSASQDINGNSIISSDSAFGASPLGVAARTQTLYGIPNANFDLTCPDPNSAVEVDNSIPYWGLESNGDIVTTMVYNETTQNWSVRMDPTGAASGDSVILKTRTYLLNDDALALRQKAFASLTRQGTTGTAQWSIVLSATYYDEAGTLLSTYNIGTAADTGTWTGINGITTSGSAAISTSAAYADIALTLTAAGSVSGTAKVDVNSVLIATSQTGGGSSSFLITQTFTSSGTFTRPTGVEYVTVVALGAGGGGYSGSLSAQRGNTSAAGGAGGTSSPWLIHENLNIGTVASVAVGIGAGGAGGTAMTFTKAAAGTAISSQTGATGALGGATTFGAFLSVGGGGTVTFTDNIYKPETMAGGFGGAGNIGAGGNGTDHRLYVSYDAAPFTPDFILTSGAAAAGSVSGGGGTAIGAAGTATLETGIAGGGAGAGGATISVTSATQAAGTGGQAAAAAGAGGGGAAARITATQTIIATGGAGGAGTTIGYGGAGGGGGGVAVAGTTTNYNASTLTITSGAGGAGQSGFLIVAWVG